jgi:hypothetical protein
MEKQAPSETKRRPSGLRHGLSDRRRTKKPEGDGFGKMNYIAVDIAITADRCDFNVVVHGRTVRTRGANRPRLAEKEQRLGSG